MVEDGGEEYPIFTHNREGEAGSCNQPPSKINTSNGYYGVSTKADGLLSRSAHFDLTLGISLISFCCYCEDDI